MIEDLLTHDERLRLEALSQSVQANSSPMGTHKPSSEKIVSDASKFADWILKGRLNS